MHIIMMMQHIVSKIISIDVLIVVTTWIAIRHRMGVKTDVMEYAAKSNLMNDLKRIPFCLLLVIIANNATTMATNVAEAPASVQNT